MEFADGGTISGDSAIIQLPAGSLFYLGEGGGIDLGESGAMTGLNELVFESGEALDVEGQISLGQGGDIRLGSDAVLHIAVGGNIEVLEDGVLLVDGVSELVVNGFEQDDISLGQLSGGEASLTAKTLVDVGEAMPDIAAITLIAEKIVVFGDNISTKGDLMFTGMVHIQGGGLAPDENTDHIVLNSNDVESAIGEQAVDVGTLKPNCNQTDTSNSGAVIYKGINLAERASDSGCGIDLSVRNVAHMAADLSDLDLSFSGSVVTPADECRQFYADFPEAAENLGLSVDEHCEPYNTAPAETAIQDEQSGAFGLDFLTFLAGLALIT